MKNPIKFRNAALCEYVAKGAGNKYTLVNVYSGDVIISSMPSDLMFGIYIELIVDFSIKTDIFMEILVEKTPIAKLPVDVSKVGNGKLINIVVQSMPMHVEKDVTLEVIAHAPGRQTTTILSKRLYRGDIPQHS
ncbi:hypothetical protein GCM10010869_49770 [Mesorhizobium tianshanense]|uniref:hypothetical protein n=1 Tax=Mesorhizobium tianshanense TaxID=39844 RepID=UPI0011A1CA5F|nr:hypothetical protein [Mesorhizobium tianshanense]GLS39380.1 hypothetical protein GCM10010869_49770 [Mesorhizobium tianshanense]